MRTVKAACPREELRQQALPLRSPHTCFMTNHGSELGDASGSARLLHEALQEKAVQIQDTVQLREPFVNQAHLGTSSEPSDLPDQHPVVVKAADTELRLMSIELFRKYFSPSMHLIFPLIAHQQALHGLDFTSTQTWGVRCGGRNVGAVAWRVRKPLLVVKECDISRIPTPILEVLFISVWEDYRNGDCGALMVAALEEEARSHACGFMYVEIGHEQPLARRFWQKNGFCLASKAGVTNEQSLFFDNACLRFADTEQYVKQLNA